MISIYEVLTDKYGEYYISYEKKHRIKTLENKNKKIKDSIINFYGSFENFEKLDSNNIIDTDYINYYKENYINYKIIFINGKKHIQFGGN